MSGEYSSTDPSQLSRYFPLTQIRNFGVNVSIIAADIFWCLYCKKIDCKNNKLEISYKRKMEEN